MIDLWHPLATLHWEEYQCHPPPSRPAIDEIQCVFLKNKLYISTRGDYIYIYNTDFTALPSVKAPYRQGYSITTYRSQLVVIGGIDTATYKEVNKVWVSDDGLNWEPSLPPLPTAYANPFIVNTGSPEYLIVAGEDKVYVLMKGQWMAAHPFPRAGVGMSYTIHSWNLYLYQNNCCGNNDFPILYCNLDSFLATTNSEGPFKDSLSSKLRASPIPEKNSHLFPLVPQSSSPLVPKNSSHLTTYSKRPFEDTFNSSSLWRRLEVTIPEESPCLFSLGKQMIIMEGIKSNEPNDFHRLVFHGTQDSAKICAYSPSAETWIQVGEVPHSLHSPNLPSVESLSILPSGELLVVRLKNYQWKVLRASWNSMWSQGWGGGKMSFLSRVSLLHSC